MRPARQSAHVCAPPPCCPLLAGRPDIARPRPRGHRMRRRELILALGGAAAWQLAAPAQQVAIPVIGFLHSASDTLPDRLRGFRQGLKDTGYVEGETVATVYRWAENEIDRLPELVAELARRQVAVLVTIGNATTLRYDLSESRAAFSAQPNQSAAAL